MQETKKQDIKDKVTEKPKTEEKKVDYKPKKVEEKKIIKKKKREKEKKAHFARFKAINLPISTKVSVEICGYLRNRPLEKAKAILNQVINKKMAIPYKRYNRDVGHKPGIAAGRYPEKAAKHILKVLNAAEAAAENKGLDAKNLIIYDLKANLGTRQQHYGRAIRTQMKRTHIEIGVKEK
jgi:large subunit ribosomal protein L22